MLETVVFEFCIQLSEEKRTDLWYVAAVAVNDVKRIMRADLI